LSTVSPALEALLLRALPEPKNLAGARFWTTGF
jgi:hypothetical protein